MSQVIRVSLPGYNALTDTNPDHFALYSDEDWILVKEFGRSDFNINVAPGSYEPISLAPLDYAPTVFVFYAIGNAWRSVTGQFMDYNDTTTEPVLNPFVGILGNQLRLVNPTGEFVAFRYFICYDQQV